MDITTKTLEELKALAYDVLVVRDNATRNLQLIEAEIAKKTPKTEEAAESKKK